MSNLIGQSFGRYHILEQLGEGGMAVVYKAFDTRLEADVAVKVIRTEKLTEETRTRALKRFESEAKALARLTHPNIVKVTDYGEHEGKPYLVMPYLQAGTLKQYLGKPVPWQEALRLLLPVAHALGYAHKHNIIHRDVKPSNILLTESGQPMLGDFGIAKVIEEDVTIDLTGTRGTIGTPEYMSPEQGLGKAIDSRTDIYALGVVLYELVTGRKPFRGDTPMETLFKHVNDPLPRPTKFITGLPLSIENILVKSLAKNPGDRYDSMDELVTALEEVLQGKVKPSKKEPRPKKKEQDVGRQLWLQFVNAVKALVKKMTDLTGQAKAYLVTKKYTGMSRRMGYFGLTGLAAILLMTLSFVISSRKNALIAPPASGQNKNHIADTYYVSSASGKRQIYYFSVNGVRQISQENGKGENWSPVPDGQGNLYFVSNRSGETDIYVLTTNGKINRVTTTQGAANSWSPAPDGRGNLYFVSERNGEIDIYVLTANGKANRVTTTQGAANSWSPAPDGQGNLYFVSNRSGEIDIYVLTANGKINRVTTTQGAANSWSPAPDGQGNLYFVSNRSGKTGIYVLIPGEGVKGVATIPTSAESWLREPKDYPDDQP